MLAYLKEAQMALVPEKGEVFFLVVGPIRHVLMCSRVGILVRQSVVSQ